jgi:hypothetical protein
MTTPQILNFVYLQSKQSDGILDEYNVRKGGVVADISNRVFSMSLQDKGTVG